MKRTLRKVALLACAGILTAAAQDSTRLLIHRTGAGLELSWPSGVQGADGSTVRPYFELQRTRDLRLWQPVSERQQAVEELSLRLTLPLDQANAFFRLLSIEPPNVAKLGNGGGEVFGYGDA